MCKIRHARVISQNGDICRRLILNDGDTDDDNRLLTKLESIAMQRGKGKGVNSDGPCHSLRGVYICVI